MVASPNEFQTLSLSVSCITLGLVRVARREYRLGDIIHHVDYIAHWLFSRSVIAISAFIMSWTIAENCVCALLSRCHATLLCVPFNNLFVNVVVAFNLFASFAFSLVSFHSLSLSLTRYVQLMRFLFIGVKKIIYILNARPDADIYNKG